MGLTDASSTPQPFRNPTDTAQIVRNQQESEKWDDLLAVVFAADSFSSAAYPVAGNVWFTLQSVLVPCGEVCRLDISGNWSVTIPVSGSTEIGIRYIVTQQSLGLGAEAGTSAYSTLFNGATINQVNVAKPTFFDVDAPGLYSVALQGQFAAGGTTPSNTGASALTVRRGRKPTT